MCDGEQWVTQRLTTLMQWLSHSHNLGRWAYGLGLSSFVYYATNMGWKPTSWEENPMTLCKEDRGHCSSRCFYNTWRHEFNPLILGHGLWRPLTSPLALDIIFLARVLVDGLVLEMIHMAWSDETPHFTLFLHQRMPLGLWRPNIFLWRHAITLS
jgi:hypothetical protein